MRKLVFKNIIFALTIVLMIGLVIVLSACGHEHTYGEWGVEKEATCTKSGLKIRTCECGEEESEIIPATGHTEGEWVVNIEPTCTESGNKSLICADCSAAIKNSAVPQLGHTEGEWIVDKNPTCTQFGSKHQVCSVCNDTIATDVIAPLGHSLGEWTQTLAPTCTEKGSERRDCRACDHFEAREINANGHTNKEVIVENKIDATCTADGSYDSVIYCSVCNGEVSRETNTTEALGHTYTEWIQSLAPTCTEEGASLRCCLICNNWDRKTITPHGHINGEWITDADATCTTDGRKHQVCSVCNATIKTEVISAKGHVFGNWYIEIDASCASEGLKARICSCGAKEYKTFSVIHTTDFVEAVEMSGIFYEKRYCSICAVEFHKPYDAVTVDLTITKLSISDNVTFGWQISASGGIGEKKYYCVVYERYSGKILTMDAYYGYTGAVRWDGNDLCVRVYMYDDVGIVVYDFVVNHGSGSINNPPETIVEPYHLI